MNHWTRIRIYLEHSPAHAGNIALVFNPSTEYVSLQFDVVFNDEFTFIPAMRTNTIPLNWVDLVSKSVECVSNMDIDSSKIWFSQQHSNSDDSESGLASLLLSIDNVSLEASAINAHSPSKRDNLSTFVNQSSEGANQVDPHNMLQSTACERESTTQHLKDYLKMKMSLHMKDISLDMPHIINLDEAGLRRLLRLNKNKMKHIGRNIFYNLHTGTNNDCDTIDPKLLVFQERVLYF